MHVAMYACMHAAGGPGTAPSGDPDVGEGFAWESVGHASLDRPLASRTERDIHTHGPQCENTQCYAGATFHTTRGGECVPLGPFYTEIPEYLYLFCTEG